MTRGIAAPTVDDFETPLGQTLIDAAALAKVADLPFVVRSDAPHAPEHALEVELPFLQMLLPSFQIVPLVVGDAAAQSVAEVLGILWGRPETLIVVSSDLSHYHGYEAARRLDAATAAACREAHPHDRQVEIPPGRGPRTSSKNWATCAKPSPASLLTLISEKGSLATE